MLNLNELQKTKINRGILIILPVLSILISCNSYKDLKNGQSAISFHSAFENDTLNVKVNNAIRLQNHKIDMISELGISKYSTIYVNGTDFRVSGTYKTTKIIDKELGLKFNRTLEFDTILKAKNGRYIDISANDKSIIIDQRKKIKIVE